MLLSEPGLAPDSFLARAVDPVFSVRATPAVPVEISDPPPGWTEIPDDRRRPHADLTRTEPRLGAAIALVRGFWADPHHTDDPTDAG
ncbi:hypothetical protein Athai_38140 [Actinocatenispora thailandica]|uniref:Uncharacterized protein n=1 Tax=Actinocatenispora thailandica TaxID=227318 RepID=A0A7R7DRC0_9ACTN|nr:hypothetical protein Athai_38140 [Actinocatenispora thailandica]